MFTMYQLIKHEEVGDLGGCDGRSADKLGFAASPEEKGESS